MKPRCSRLLRHSPRGWGSRSAEGVPGSRYTWNGASEGSTSPPADRPPGEWQRNGTRLLRRLCDADARSSRKAQGSGRRRGRPQSSAGSGRAVREPAGGRGQPRVAGAATSGLKPGGRGEGRANREEPSWQWARYPHTSQALAARTKGAGPLSDSFRGAMLQHRIAAEGRIHLPARLMPVGRDRGLRRLWLGWAQ